jgi:hypothetical protein
MRAVRDLEPLRHISAQFARKDRILQFARRVECSVQRWREMTLVAERNSGQCGRRRSDNVDGDNGAMAEALLHSGLKTSN